MNILAVPNDTSFGYCATGLLAALEAAGHAPHLTCLHEPSGEIDMGLVGRAAARPVRPTAPWVKVWHPWDASRFPESARFRAVWTFFEADRLRPEEVQALQSVDLALVPTEWHREVCLAHRLDRVAVLSPGVDLAALEAARPLRPHNVSHLTTVFWTVGKAEYRKGHDLLVQAFDSAFGPSDDVMLAAHLHNRLTPADSARWRRLYLDGKMGRADKVWVSDGWLPRETVLGLTKGCDAAVFLSRSEGWGLGAAEALAVGKEVALTDCPGHREFGPDAGAVVLPVGPPEPAFDGVFFHGEGSWPSLTRDTLDACVEWMRNVHRRGPLRNAEGPELFRGPLSWASCARRLLALTGQPLEVH